MADKIKLRRDTQANWEAVNPILDEGELGVILDSNGLVIGDGVTGFTKLPQKRSFSEDIDITIGPGGDFETPEEALNYIEFLVPKYKSIDYYTVPDFSGAMLTFSPTINLIFKENFVFTRPFIIMNRYIPWVNLTQENTSVPLQITHELAADPDVFYAPSILLYNTTIGNVNLNVTYTGTILPVSKVVGLSLIHNSHIQNLYFRGSKFAQAVSLQNSSTIKYIFELTASQCYNYGLYLGYNSFALVQSDSTMSFNDIGITYPGLGYAIGANTAMLIVYGGNTTIDNVKGGFGIWRNGKIEIHPGAHFTISNVVAGIHIEDNSEITVYEPITFGTGITVQYEPTDLIINSWDHRGRIIADPSLAAI